MADELFEDAGQQVASREAEVRMSKQKRIDQILWGIRFAREVMKTSQADVDRRLAEMLADAELDLKLF